MFPAALIARVHNASFPRSVHVDHAIPPPTAAKHRRPQMMRPNKKVAVFKDKNHCQIIFMILAFFL